MLVVGFHLWLLVHRVLSIVVVRIAIRFRHKGYGDCDFRTPFAFQPIDFDYVLRKQRKPLTVKVIGISDGVSMSQSHREAPTLSTFSKMASSGKRTKWLAAHCQN